MQEKKRKILLISLEVISLAIILPIFYWYTLKLVIDPIEIHVFEVIPTMLFFLIVIGFDILWIVLMRACPRINIHIKVVLTVLILTLSASFLTCLIVLQALSDAFV